MTAFSKPCNSCLKPVVFLKGAYTWLFVNADTYATSDGVSYNPDKHMPHCKTCTGKPPEKERRK